MLIGWIILVLALVLIGALVPGVPYWLKLILFIAAAVLVLLMVLGAVGAIDGPYFSRPVLR